MRQKCFYNQFDCSGSLTREHVVSKAVLKVAFGDPIRNIASGDAVNGRSLDDHEALVKDVCQKCNNEKLSRYDAAGADFVQAIDNSWCAEDPFPFSPEILGWILKTHFNYFRVIKDSARGTVYEVPQVLKDALVQHQNPALEAYRLHMQTFTPEPNYFDADDVRRLPWIGYRSVRLLRQGIVISELRLKHLYTWLLVPANGKLRRFGHRANDAIAELSADFAGNIPAALDISAAIRAGRIVSPHVLPPEVFAGWIRAR